VVDTPWEDAMKPGGQTLDESDRRPDVVNTATKHAVTTFLPQPERTRQGIALCLSGGGFRAALFHLGALRRLNELGVLTRVDVITSVSGGSIVAAHLVRAIHEYGWPPPGDRIDAPEWEERVGEPFRRFTRQNLRTDALLARLRPRNWFKASPGVAALEQAYHSRLTDLRLGELPDRPQFVFCATDMTFGSRWRFAKDGVGRDQQELEEDDAPGICLRPNWSVARAVAASSCFPPVFNPLPIARVKRGGRELTISLTDGGLYDNLGIEAVWRTAATVLVSDGGATFDIGSTDTLLWRLSRYEAIIGEQAKNVRRRWLMSNFLKGELQGTYWGIGSTTAHFGPSSIEGYSEALVDDIVSEVRTDMDAFSDPEIRVLENHGYLLADAAMVRNGRTSVELLQTPRIVPWPEWMDEGRVRAALGSSNKRTLFGRGWPRRE